MDILNVFVWAVFGGFTIAGIISGAIMILNKGVKHE
jgi:hypothetical protein